jgi:hypothetical protein
MLPTVIAAMLAHPEKPGTALGLLGREKGRPIHLSLHTSTDGARAELVKACRREWDDPERGLDYGMGPSSAWRDENVPQVMRDHGYVLSVMPLPVTLDGTDPEPNEADDAARDAELDASIAAHERDLHERDFGVDSVFGAGPLHR